MKTAYKDLRSKLSDRTPPKSTSRECSMAATTATRFYQHNSAPNSPVFTKRPQTELFSINHSNHRKPHTMLQTSNSMMNNSNFTNHINNNDSNNSNSHMINKSPSPTSSVSSSEMNILQELQQHALFKLPTVDRSVSSFDHWH